MGWLLLATLIAGCTRQAYRKAADRDAYALTCKEEKKDPAFDIGRLRIEPDPASRLADHHDPDHPPEPPDDPAAHQVMLHPGGMRGARHWDKDGCVDRIEDESWLDQLGLDEKGRLALTPERAMDIALLNSREYQNSLDLVYFAALDVSLKRFAFSPQWFAGDGAVFTHLGSGGLLNGESNTLTTDPTMGFDLALAAGGQLVVDFANSLTWQYTGGTSRIVSSNLILSLTQPLLRNFGREIALEPLTQSERNLLYAVRTFARFRKQFWANVTTENSGYLNLLLQLQSIRNQKADLKSWEQNYRLHLELFDGGKASRVQVDQVFRGFLNARLSVAQTEAFYESSLDSYKLRLGLPPRIPIDIDDSLLSQFQLVPAALERLRDDTSQFQLDRFKELNNVPTTQSLRESYERLRSLIKQAPSSLELVQQDLDEGFRLLDSPLKAGQDPEQRQRARKDYTRFRVTLGDVKRDLAALPARLDRDLSGLSNETRKESWERILILVRDYLAELDDMIAIQTVLRINHIQLPDLDDTEDSAVAEALNNRLDLMNQKALVTDAWRQVTVTANALRGDLNLTASTTVNGAPVGFSTPNSGFSAGLQYNAPLNRFAERNAYRTAQLVYQRARRDYMGAEDSITQTVRQDLRQLTVTRLNFEISRESLISAARQAEAVRNQLLAAQDSTGTSTIQMIDALNSVLSARNALAASYINYEQLRIQLLLDLDRLQLDPRGFPTNERASTSPVGNTSPAIGLGSEPLPPPRPLPEADR